MVDHLVFYVIHPWVIYCSGSPLWGNNFWSLPPNSTSLSEKVPLSLSMYLIPRDNHISVYRTKIHRAVAKFSKFFSLCPCLSMPPFQPLHFIGACWLLWHHTTPTAAQTFCMLFMNQIDLKMHINEQIIIKIYGEFEYKCIRR